MDLPETADVNEVNAMLAERVLEWTKQWKAEGLEEGRKEGRKEGLKEGEALLLLRQLENKFGPLDKTSRARLEGADADQLLTWGERVLTADSLEAVFEADSQSPSK